MASSFTILLVWFAIDRDDEWEKILSSHATSHGDGFVCAAQSHRHICIAKIPDKSDQTLHVALLRASAEGDRTAKGVPCLRALSPTRPFLHLRRKMSSDLV